MNEPLLTIVIPCYNEEKVVKETVAQLSIVLVKLVQEQLIHKNSKLLFVDDGSQDHTWRLIMEISDVNPFVTGIKLARNVGHQPALLAGMLQARKYSDCVLTIDADLQDDISKIRDFILKYRDGYDVVYGVRNKRATDTFFKRTTAILFYRFLKKMGVHIVHNHADYRLMSKRALDELNHYKERNLFLRGIVPLLGFRSATVLYDRKERFAGESKYPLKKMLTFAFDGITSFSITPIRFITLVGFLSFFTSGIFGSYAVIQRILGYTTPGWTSLIISIWLIGGIQLMGVGLIGEYIGKIYKEVKQRPHYAIETDLYSVRMQAQEWLSSPAPSMTDHEKTS
ncbi:glycosyltransferase family 2 protein [Ectobacillus panaciterrae]|uniref:glycosyltransferase family 2 protein n=1 Tax=Ectobacillus panaciterrae TaxID=363872 RepID=UPI000420D8E1|nr:glycosyltransferase family 2 protein [Ectobacillus panaciterrae]